MYSANLLDDCVIGRYSHACVSTKANLSAMQSADTWRFIRFAQYREWQATKSAQESPNKNPIMLAPNSTCVSPSRPSTSFLPRYPRSCTAKATHSRTSHGTPKQRTHAIAKNQRSEERRVGKECRSRWS